MSEIANTMMDQTIPKRKYRLILDFKCQFPEKLYDVASDGHLIYWNRDDSVSIRDEEEFENNVMTLYPGFLQIPTILNLKRLFREYAFERDVGPNGSLKFSHPCFQRGRRALLSEIRTRRKSFYKPQYCNNEDSSNSVIEAEEGKRYPTRKRRRTSRFKGNESFNGSEATDSRCSGDFIEKSGTAFHIKKPTLHPLNGTNTEDINAQGNRTKDNRSISIKEDLPKIMNEFAKNEFSEQEFAEWLAKKKMMDALKSNKNEETKAIETTKDFWWMYEADVNDTNKSSATEPVEQEMCMPCGFCKCCSAISNYVHIFGEVPENIQVYDIVEEVFEAEDSSSAVQAAGNQKL